MNSVVMRNEGIFKNKMLWGGIEVGKFGFNMVVIWCVVKWMKIYLKLW